MPFVTEELWDRFGYGEPCSLIRTAWPEPVAVPDAAAARDELDWVVRLISEVRSVRTEMNVPPATLTPILLRDARTGDAGARRALDGGDPSARARVRAEAADRRDAEGFGAGGAR